MNFQKGNGLIPAIVQEQGSGEILMLGFMNQQAYQKTKQTGVVWFWSRSRNRLWMKGETSGDTLKVVKIVTDCDEDSLLIEVIMQGKATCHNGTKSCFMEVLYESQ